jgi:hypothetical protein
VTSKEWYLNLDFVSKLKKEFEKAGLPLEYRAKKIFEDKGFNAFESHYKFPSDHIFDTDIDQKEGIWRQIDITAAPKDDSLDFELTFGEFRLVLTPYFIAECKFSSNKSFFLFRSESDYVHNFPSTIWGNKLLPFEFDLYELDKESFSECQYDPTKHFNLDIYENVVEVDLEHLDKKDNNFNDQTTYRACEQLYNALNFHLSVSKPELRDSTYVEIFKSNLLKKWLLYLKTNSIKEEDAMSFGNEISKSIALKFLKENFDLADIQNIFHYIICNFPILIVNERAGLFEVIFDENSNIQNFEKIKYGIYVYNSRECYSRDRCIYPDSLGIIICDVCYLGELIDSIKDGIQKLGHQLEKNLHKWPYLLGYELLFNSELIDPKDYFLESTKL